MSAFTDRLHARDAAYKQAIISEATSEFIALRVAYDAWARKVRPLVDDADTTTNAYAKAAMAAHILSVMRDDIEAPAWNIVRGSEDI